MGWCRGYIKQPYSEVALQESSGISLYTESKINPYQVKESQWAGNKSSQAEKLIERILREGEAGFRRRPDKMVKRGIQSKKLSNPNS